MKALTFDPSNNRFQIADLEVPEVGSSDVLIKVDACGLNPVDAGIARWKSRAPNMSNLWVPGLDVSGQITEIGEDVTGWKIGDRVLCHGNMYRPHGGFAEYTIQDADTLIPHPKTTPEIAAATPCAGWTAWRALVDKLRVKEHDSILITGGSGGVGSFAIQIARYYGLKTIIVTSSARNHTYVKELDAPTADGDDQVHGVAASSGQYTGTVRVVHDDNEFGKLQPGDVLVCPITTSAWSVLFSIIGALVTDTGGLLSHPAIIAREYGIPSVLATGNATSTLKDGQLVTVDGTSGQVKIHS